MRAGTGGAQCVPSYRLALESGSRSSQVIGLTHPPHFEKTAEAVRMLGLPRALVVRGVEGDPELSIAMTTKVLEFATNGSHR